MKASRSIRLPDGWDSIVNVNESTWAVVLHDSGTSEVTSTHVVRYEIQQFGVFKVDYRTGIREPVSGKEGVEFFNAIAAYNDAVRDLYNMHRRPEAPEMRRIDGLPSRLEPDDSTPSE
jgi:hypothetical protein